MEQYNESHFLRKEPCPKCSSRDNLARYSDGHAKCFTNGCNHYEHADGSPSDQGSSKKETKPVAEALRPYFDGETTDLAVRKITEETCRRYGYRVATVETRDGTKKAQIAPYYKDGQLAGAKVRFPGKEFTTWGNFRNPALFGSQLQDKGKILVVTEGEIDAMSVSQAQGNKYAAVSVPNGAAGAAKSFRDNLEYFSGFETVVIFFDMDEVGQKAAKECAELLPPGKAKIAHITGAKDANDLLQQGRVSDIITAIWQAKAFRPDGIVTIADIREKALKPPEMGLPWFLEGVTNATYGRRLGELYCFGAGTGVGKTDWLIQQIEYDINTLKKPVSVIFLEQAPSETLQRIAGKMDGKLYHIPDGLSTREELASAIDKIECNGKVFLYDSWGASEWDVIKNKVRYLAHSEGVELFYIDHLTALAAMADDEKKALEKIMAEMAGLCQELGIIIHLVSHLSTPEGGKSHEEGARVMIKHYKGSRSIGFWCHFIFAIERDQQDEEQRNQSLFRILKDRNTGRATGLTFPLYYDAETGLISSAPAMVEF